MIKPFHKQFKDRIDPADGSVPLREIEYNQIVADVLTACVTECQQRTNQHDCSRGIILLWDKFKHA